MNNRLDVPVAGGELATYRLGAAGPQAPLVLAIHGITSSSRTWLAVARQLGERATLLAVDLRGRARSSELPPPYGLDAHVRDMVAVLDHFGLERAVIAGHSLGAYIAARLAVEKPERVDALALVDGGLTIPESRGAEPVGFVEEFLGPSFARLEMTFDTPAAYRAWWAEHPAFAGSDIEPADLDQYAAHDLVGSEPQLRSSVVTRAVRDDGLDVFDPHDADRLEVPAVFLSAPGGMVGDSNPMQPLELVERWAADSPRRRRAVLVPGVNHFTIVLGRAGAGVVAGEIADLLRGRATPAAAHARPSG
jgi:pimeloyl-ACP methyl ester carboxylesterase